LDASKYVTSTMLFVYIVIIIGMVWSIRFKTISPHNHRKILRFFYLVVGLVVALAAVEMEEEKANLFQLLLMLGLTMLFAAFGLMSLMVLIIWAVDPQYRLNAMIATTVVLLLLALIGGIWTLRKSRKSTLLRHTRHELANDRQLLEEESREQ